LSILDVTAEIKEDKYFVSVTDYLKAKTWPTRETLHILYAPQKLEAMQCKCVIELLQKDQALDVSAIDTINLKHTS
jgi:hypothetical protein